MLKRFVVVSVALALAVVAAVSVGPAIAPKGVQEKRTVLNVENAISEVDYDDLPIKRGRFLYLTQGPSVPPAWLCDVGSRSDSDVIWASFKEEVNTVCEGIANTIYAPDTSWTAGRNALYAKALALQQQQGWRAEYLVFTDDDVQLFTTPGCGNPYDVFHAALGNVQPAVAGVGFKQTARNICGPVAPCAPDIDAIFNAFHATAAPILLPYDTYFDDVDWWSAQGILIELMSASMPEHVVQFNQLWVTNGDHRAYPKSGVLCVKPADGGLSEVAKYLQPRVSECMRDQIGTVEVGSGATCQACEKSCACTLSADCSPAPAVCGATSNASEPINYADVVKCKPRLKMGKGGFQGQKPDEPLLTPEMEAMTQLLMSLQPAPAMPMPFQPCPGIPIAYMPAMPAQVMQMPAALASVIQMPANATSAEAMPQPAMPQPAVPIPVMPMPMPAAPLG
jgi:hypothetical protein